MSKVVSRGRVGGGNSIANAGWTGGAGQFVRHSVIVTDMKTGETKRHRSTSRAFRDRGWPIDNQFRLLLKKRGSIIHSRPNGDRYGFIIFEANRWEEFEANDTLAEWTFFKGEWSGRIVR